MAKNNKKSEKEKKSRIIDTTSPRNLPTDDAKLYKIFVNGTPIDVDAASMYFAKGRVNKYIKTLKEESLSQTGSLRGFWADIIMLNLITNGMLSNANPYILEQILNPVKYFTLQKAKEFYQKEQEKVELQRKKEQEDLKNSKEEKGTEEEWKSKQ